MTGNEQELAPEDTALLRRSFELAEAARRHGNHPFGALLAGPQGEILLEAENTVLTDQDVTGHAELNLVRAASRRLTAAELRASSMYSSAEPCPMCAGALHWSGIFRLIYGLSAPRLYGLSAGPGDEFPIEISCREILRHSGRKILVIGPALEEAAERVHSGFWGGN